ncbi:unnamed protein product [Prorocentrum cordatum]|uniref:HEAT repeat-containing protein 1 n=1 Tax=Prorocentrum cordatum TaxID=2364126 RepID=A0ABN9XNJ7_9DINO|nr:unnamed protein product [Polarella glacialis]
MDAGRVAAALRAVIGLRVPPETLGYLAEVLSELSAEELSDPLEVRTLLEPFLLDALKPGRERPTDTKSLVLVEALCEEVHGRLMAGLSAAGPPARCGEGPADQRCTGSQDERQSQPPAAPAAEPRGRDQEREALCRAAEPLGPAAVPQGPALECLVAALEMLDDAEVADVDGLSALVGPTMMDVFHELGDWEPAEDSARLRAFCERLSEGLLLARAGAAVENMRGV